MRTTDRSKYEHLRLPDPATLIPLKRFYVYVLRNAAGEIVYVGQSHNVFGRVGAHVKDVDKGAEVDTIQLIECTSAGHMDYLERALIYEWAPKFNRAWTGIYRGTEEIRERGRRVRAIPDEMLA